MSKFFTNFAVMNQTVNRSDVKTAHLALLLANIGWGVIAPVSKMVLLSHFRMTWLKVGGVLMIPLAQRSLKPTVVSAYSYLQPVFAAIVAVMMSVGDFGWGKVGATALIFVGIYLVNRSSSGNN